ncbi:TPA: acyltransferase [Vibrio parahaemolyticus]|uniref:Galactoside O-acetyltransferase n=1 Tax=Vibrio parahaemolyticus TaxID=670 RepID=A0A7M1WMZ2_VIBPH|nr:acyltransferase [Vibrio parahaemolyticus]EID0729992.1 acyltransferase [Vibrio parahaemolyticus]ELN6867948.1 acyltransferase [Vibrio parahaemolyticus]MDI7833602.1 acyltransferase [Vibrio parahaemolyticus]QOS28514.1 galactoside O-acetyltransferase [Vibrio parahaemolyticus]TBT79763.1 acyltransferase [Vibrio parahaemolyticus]
MIIKLVLALTNRFRMVLNKLKFIDSRVSTGANIKICGFCTLSVIKNNVRVGKCFFANSGLIISNNKYSPITIGDDVMLGYGVKVLGGNHDYSHTTCHMRHISLPSSEVRPIVIGDGVWIGTDSIILSGANIGEGAIIGAGSVVTSKIPPYCIAVGVPAVPVKMRFSSTDKLEEILKNTKSKLNSNDVMKEYESFFDK